MPKYIGQPCTSCRNVFKEGDEIVVCPECGSPYHKDCFKAEGRCVNTLLHESGESWQPAPEISQPESASAGEPLERVCGNCGAKNGPDAYYCSSCGAPLSEVERPNPNIGNPYVRPEQPGGQFGYGQAGIPPFLNVGSITADSEIDENTVGEYTDYVGPKFYYYIPKFMRFSKSRSKLSFNFAAFFFPYFWFPYRKMPVLGIVSLVISFALSFPNLAEYVSELGGVSFGWLSSGSFAAIYNVCAVLSYVFSILCGLFANWIYYKKARRDILKIKSEVAEVTARKTAIISAGGVSMIYFAATVGIMFVLSAILTTFLLG